MRSHTSLLLVLLLAALLTIAPTAYAVPVTGGTGPGGVGKDDGTSDLEIWLKADAGVLNAGATAATDTQEAATWEDQSGNGFDVTAVAGRRPVFNTGQFNSQPALTFTADAFTRAAIVSAGNSGRTVIAVTQTNNNDNVGIIDLSDGAGLGTGERYIVTPEVAVRVSGNKEFNEALSTTNPEVLTVRNDTGENVTATDGFINGGALTLDMQTAAALNLAGDTTLIGRHSASSYFSGRMSEIVVFDRELSDAERISIENSVNSKYDLDSNATLTFTDDHYEGDLNANGDYDFDVFGVGQTGGDDHPNGGSAGFGIEAVGASLGDDEWLFAGHASTSNGIVDPIEGDGVAGERWQRVWYLDQTGEVDATFGFDFSDAGLAAPSAGDQFSLLYSPTESFNWSILGSGSLSGDLVTFGLLGSQVLDGYYTLGINVQAIPEPSSLMLLTLGCCGLLSRRRRGAPTARRRTIPLRRSRWVWSMLMAACAVLALGSATHAVPVAPGLIAYFPLDESPGSSTASNAVSGGNTGTLQNFPDLNAAWVTDTPPQLAHSTRSLLFPGFDASIIGVDISGTSPVEYINSEQQFTLSAWFQLGPGALPDPNPNSLFPFISTLSNNTTESWGVFFASSANPTYEAISFGSASQWLPQSTTSVSAATIDDGAWHHLLITFDGVDEDASSSYALYLDGIQRTLSNPGGLATNVNELIGAGDATRFNMNGNIDDFALFSEVLNAEQIAFLAEGGSPLFLEPIPEPSTLLLLSFGFAGLAGRKRRRR